MTIVSSTKRPRNVDWPRAAAMLYGDWGTSKAYVVGLAFAVAGYSSFWLIAAMALLTALVGVNYMIICRHYPDGGGVYASVRHRSEIISIVGAFLLIADYLVTAAISALSAFQYLNSMLGVPHPELFAAAAIIVIGGLNFFGPRHTGGLAFLIAIPTVVVVVALGMFALPHLGAAIRHLEPLHDGFWKNWRGFVGVVLALSGVEAVANATGIMKLDPGSNEAKPNVSKTSTPAILWVMLEVCLFTVLLSLASHALGGLTVHNGEVDALPDNPGVRDYMLRYMAQVFVGGSLGFTLGHVAAWAVTLVFFFLLLSAVNTSIVGLIAIQFLMSRDRELPGVFQRLNNFGVPNLAVIVATLIPALLVVSVRDMVGLADLYAVGVVGAIATNLGATSTDKKVQLTPWQRMVMFGTFLIMLAIELSLLIDKPGARAFATAVLALGLILRGLVSEAGRKKDLAAATTSAATVPLVISEPAITADPEIASSPPIVCAVRGLGKTLDFALEEAKLSRRPLYLLFVRAVPVLSEADHKRRWPEDEDARTIFSEAKKMGGTHPVLPCYAVSDSVADTIVDITATVGASLLVLGAPVRNRLLHLLRGDIVQRVSENLPEDIHLLVYA